MASEHDEPQVTKYVTIDSGATQHVAGANARSLLENIQKLDKATRLHLPNGVCCLLLVHMQLCIPESQGVFY